MMKFYKQFYETWTKKSSKQNIVWSINMLWGFRACTVQLADELFCSLPPYLLLPSHEQSSSKYWNAYDNRNLQQWLIYPILSQCSVFYPLKSPQSYKVYWSFQEIKGSTLNCNGLTTSDKFLTHIFYRLKTSESHTVFKSFQGSKNGNTDLIWVKANMFINI